LDFKFILACLWGEWLFLIKLLDFNYFLWVIFNDFDLLAFEFIWSWYLTIGAFFRSISWEFQPHFICYLIWNWGYQRLSIYFLNFLGCLHGVCLDFDSFSLCIRYSYTMQKRQIRHCLIIPYSPVSRLLCSLKVEYAF
jgi:hypothetical protein